MLGGESAQAVDHGRHPAGNNLQALAQQQQIGVVGDKATGRAQVDDRPGVGTLVAVGVDVGHHVVAQLAFVAGRSLEVHVVHMGLQLVDLALGNRQAQLGLRLGQRNPEPPPRAELALRTPQRAHLRRGITANQRIVVLIQTVTHGV